MNGAAGPEGGLTPGQQLGHLEYLLTTESQELYRQAVEYSEASYPNLAIRDYRSVLAPFREPVSIVCAARADRLYRPPAPGRRVQLTGWLRDWSRQAGAEYLTVDTFAVDDIGAELYRSQYILQIGGGRNASRSGRRPAPTRKGAGAGLLPPLHKRVTGEALEQFREVSRRSAPVGYREQLTAVPDHAGAFLASGMGLTAAPAPWELGVAYLHQLLELRFGIHFRQGGRISVNFRRPMYAGDSLIARGLVVGQNPDADRVNWRLQLWLEKESGEQIITGEARITVPSPLV